MAGLTESYLDTSLTAPSSRRVKDRALKNELQEMKRTERLGRRAYRAALRGDDPSAYLKGLQALETTRALNGGSSGAGIRTTGQEERGLAQARLSAQGQVDGFNGVRTGTESDSAPGFDEDGNGIPDMIQAPPQQTPQWGPLTNNLVTPPTATTALPSIQNLVPPTNPVPASNSSDLFGRMKAFSDGPATNGLLNFTPPAQQSTVATPTAALTRALRGPFSNTLKLLNLV